MSDQYCPGPLTPQGKAISSRNSLKHGSCSDTLFLAGDNPADYESLAALWTTAYQPQNDAELHFVREIINADWFLQRATRTVSKFETELFEKHGDDPTNWTEEQDRKLGRYLRYQTTRANNLKRARKELEDYRKARAAEKTSQQKQQIASERHEIYKQKNKPFDYYETLAQLKQKSIALGRLNPDGTKKL